jgi:hypothetical protein
MLVGLTWAGRSPAAEKPQWIVVTAPAFKEALTPLCDHRSAEGLRVVVVQTTDVLSATQIRDGDASALKEHLQKLCEKSNGPSYVLLVGAARAADPATAAKIVVPPLVGTVGRMKGQPSDNGYGFRDKQPAPSVAVGRFPARSKADVRQMVEKTLAFERDRTPGAWRNRVTLLIGNPGGHSAIEKRFAELFIQQIAGTRFDQVHPLWTGRSVIHAPVSPFCVPDDRLREVSLRYLKEGQLFTLYLGHSEADGLWSGGARFLSREDWAQLKTAHGSGVLFSCGCFGCQLKGDDGEGYGLAAMRNPGGPVAVIGSHGESYGAMGQLAADGLLECLSRAEPPARLAEYWLAVKSGLAQGKMDPFIFWLYDQADGSGGKVAMDVQKQEHQEMWMLLGDPALRLPVCPPSIRLASRDVIAAGKEIEVTGVLPPDFSRVAVKLTLERPTGSKANDLEPLPMDTEKARKVMMANHERANTSVLATAEVQPRNGRFRWSVKLPENLPWSRVTVRATSATETQMAIGVLVLPVGK